MPAELCEAVRKLALRQYGLLAGTVLAHWGVRSTSDIGDIVYNLIAAGDLEKTDGDSRTRLRQSLRLRDRVQDASHEATAASASKPLESRSPSDESDLRRSRT